MFKNENLTHYKKLYSTKGVIMRICHHTWTLLAFTASFIVSSTLTTATWADEISGSVVKLHVTQRGPDYSRPWTKSAPTTSVGSGAIIEGNRILTNAHVVRFATQILVQANQSSDRYRAKLLAIAPGLDLALLEVRDEAFAKGRKQLEFDAVIPHIKDTLNVYGYPMGGEQLSITEGIVSRIEYRKASGTTSILTLQVDAALNPGNSGGPAIIDGKIIGVVCSKIKQADNIGYLIATEEVLRFLEDIKDGKYDGKPHIPQTGSKQYTENRELRKRLKLPSGVGGLLVNEELLTGPELPLKPWDVITHIGDHPLDKQGMVLIRDDLKLDYTYFIPKLLKEGKVPLTILRDGKTMKVEVPTMTGSLQVFQPLGNHYPRYYIHGPLVLMEADSDLGLPLMKGMGPTLLSARSPWILRLGDSKQYPEEEFVMLGLRFYPHPISQGYEKTPPFSIISHINDTEVKNLRQAVKLLKHAEGEYLTIKLAGYNFQIVFPREEAAELTEEILESEGIRNQCSPDLRDVE